MGGKNSKIYSKEQTLNLYQNNVNEGKNYAKKHLQ